MACNRSALNQPAALPLSLARPLLATAKQVQELQVAAFLEDLANLPRRLLQRHQHLEVLFLKEVAWEADFLSAQATLAGLGVRVAFSLMEGMLVVVEAVSLRASALVSSSKPREEVVVETRCLSTNLTNSVPPLPSQEKQNDCPAYGRRIGLWS